MRYLARPVLLVGLIALLPGCAGLDLDALLQPEPDASTPSDALREALRVGTERAVDSLGRTDGYLGNAEIRIPLPDKLEKPASALRTIGS